MTDERGPEGREGQTGREGSKGREGNPGIAGKEGPRGVRGPKGTAISTRVLIAFVIMGLIFFGITIGFSVLVLRVLDLGHENKTRISDIQESRLESCKGTYSGISEVFQPFFPPAPRTAKQQADLDKFNRTIDRLQRRCAKQIRVKVEK